MRYLRSHGSLISVVMKKSVRTPASILKVYHNWRERKSRGSSHQRTTAGIGKFFNNGKVHVAQGGDQFGYANETKMGDEGMKKREFCLDSFMLGRAPAPRMARVLFN